jgi:predicted metal-binding membrane protein
MMTAMMLPSAAPMVLAHLAVTRRRGDGFGPTLAFVAGFLTVWFGTGVVALAGYRAFAGLPDEAGRPGWLPVLAGIILIIAGAYQFTPWKQACLGKCQSPLGFVIRHDFAGGARSALRAGVLHGLYCIGCCWALMLVLSVVGLMNLLWMSGLFALIFVEKQWQHGIVVARIVGAALILLGALVIGWPEMLPLLA